MYLRIFTLKIYDVYVSSFCVLYVFSDKLITYLFCQKNADFSMNMLTKGSCTACLEKIFVTFTFVILVVGITLGKNLPQF